MKTKRSIEKNEEGVFDVLEQVWSIEEGDEFDSTLVKKQKVTEEWLSKTEEELPKDIEGLQKNYDSQFEMLMKMEKECLKDFNSRGYKDFKNTFEKGPIRKYLGLMQKEEKYKQQKFMVQMAEKDLKSNKEYLEHLPKLRNQMS